jgi:hypothetical protein
LGVPGVGNWRGVWGALGERRENRKGAPGDVRRGRSVLAIMILEGMNCLDVYQKSATIYSDILSKLPLRPEKSIRFELSAQPGLEANTFPAPRRVNLFPHDGVLIHCLNLHFLKFIRDPIDSVQ